MGKIVYWEALASVCFYQWQINRMLGECGRRFYQCQ